MGKLFKTNGSAIRLEEGDVICINERGLRNSLMRTVQGYKWHHMMLYLGNGKVLEAIPLKGCIILKLNIDKRYNGVKILRAARVPIKKRKLVALKAVEYFCGRKFSFIQLMKAFLTRKLRFQLFLGQKPNNWKETLLSPDKAMCSNIISMSYATIGLFVRRDHLPELIIPEDFENSSSFKVIAKLER